jgi:hypothetical protein
VFLQDENPKARVVQLPENTIQDPLVSEEFWVPLDCLANCNRYRFANLEKIVFLLGIGSDL